MPGLINQNHLLNYFYYDFLYIIVFDWQDYTLYVAIKTVSKFITNVTLLFPVLYFIYVYICRHRSSENGINCFNYSLQGARNALNSLTLTYNIKGVYTIPGDPGVIIIHKWSENVMGHTLSPRMAFYVIKQNALQCFVTLHKSPTHLNIRVL